MLAALALPGGRTPRGRGTHRRRRGASRFPAPQELGTVFSRVRKGAAHGAAAPAGRRRASALLVCATGRRLADARPRPQGAKHMPGLGGKQPTAYPLGTRTSTCLRRGRSGSGMAAAVMRRPVRRGLCKGAPIPSAIDPGRAEQTRPLASRSFVQWRAPPGRQEPRPLHGVWVDGRRDGSWRGWWGRSDTPAATTERRGRSRSERPASRHLRIEGIVTLHVGKTFAS